MRILFTGGGTGGHVYPIIALVREIKKRAEEERIADLELYYIGPRGDDFGKELFEEERVVRVPVSGGKFRRYASFQNAADIVKMGVGILEALWNFFLLVPDVVFSKGGYGAFPACAAAILFRIPLIIHESDAAPGRVNRLFARFAVRIGIAFAAAESYFPKEKTAHVGVPVRTRILGGKKEDARTHLDIFTHHPVIGFCGASQGAQKINNAVVDVLKDLAQDYEIVHQTGAKNYEILAGEARVVLEFGHRERYHAFGFLDESGMRDFYAACDLIVSRAGASSIYEIAAYAKPSILIPLAHAAQDHQRANAYEYAATGAAQIIEETNLTPHILLSEIKKLFDDPERMKKMGEAASRFSRLDSAEVVAREILKLGIH